MKTKLINALGYMLFLLLFILLLPLLMLKGVINTPIRYYQYTSAKVHNRKPKKYYF